MNKLIKWIGLGIAAVATLFIIAIIVAITLVNPNNFKTEISSLISKQTGRQMTIHGHIGWQFFPKLGLELQDVDIANPRGNFPKDKQFIHAGEVDFNIRLLPLLLGKAEIGTIKLDETTINLITNKQGQSNWQQQKHKTKPKNHVTKKSKPAVKPTKSTISLSISKLIINNGTINWENNKTNQHVILSHFKLNSRNINLRDAFPLKMQFTIEGKKPKIRGKFNVSTAITINTKDNIYALKQFTIDGQLLGKPYLRGKLPVYFSANMIANLKKHRLNASHISAKLANLDIQADIVGTKLNSTPHYQGKIRVNPFNLPNFLNAIGISYSSDNRNITRTVNFNSEFKATDKDIDFSTIHLNADHMKMVANAFYRFKKTKKLSFNVDINQLDLDQFKNSAKAPATVDKSRTHPVTTSKRRRHRKITTARQTNPFKFLRDININGKITIGQLQAANIRLTKVNADINGKQGIININPITAHLYNGSSNGSITLNTRPQIATFKVNEILNNVAIGELIKAITNKTHISGNANLSLNVNGRLTNKPIRTLNGMTKFSVRNGNIKGVDLNYYINKAKIYILKDRENDLQDTKQTPFGDLAGDAIINNGVVNNQHLLLEGEQLRARGNGIINLVNNTINYQLTLESKLIQLVQNIPLDITGSLNDPNIRLDIAKLGTGIIKTQLEKQILGNVKRVGKTTQGVGKVLQETVGKTLQEGLNRLFK